MGIKDLFTRHKKNKQQPQQEYIDIKYSKLDNIGKVNRIPIINQQTIDNIHNNIDTNTNEINNINSSVNDISTKVDKIANDLANANIANYKGIYSANISYKLGDLVSDTTTNNIYLSIKDNNTNKPLTDNSYWKIITFTIDTSDFVNNTQFQTVEKKLNGLSVHVEQISKKRSFFLTNGVVNVSENNIFTYTSGSLYVFQISKIIGGFSLDNRNNDYKSGDWLVDFEFRATFKNGYWSNFSVSKIFRITEFNNNQFLEDLLLDKHQIFLPAFNITGGDYPKITFLNVKGVVN